MADDSLTFDDQILEAAKSITSATAALVKAAHLAQKELVSQGRVSISAKSLTHILAYINEWKFS